MPEEKHNEIAIREQPSLTIQELEESFAIAVKQRELLEGYIKERLTPGKHFYRVPGSKNSLTKEGAELICLPHGYRPKYFKEGGPDQPAPDGTPYQIIVRCQLLKGDNFAGEGLGSASSYVTTRTGEYKPRQKDPGLCHNATLKIAQKSAYIAATLNATAASEFFTQDIEDGAEVNEPPSQEAAGGEHWCKEHEAAWFKRGHMRGYAHPIGNTGQWCNMEDVKAEMKRDSDVDASPPISTTMPADITTLNQFYPAACKSFGYYDKDDVLSALAVTQGIEIKERYKTLEAAWTYLAEQFAPF